jgi:hypothetical protein
MGISLLSPELDCKRQDILIEAMPGARRSIIGVRNWHIAIWARL